MRGLLLILGFVVCLTLATVLDPRLRSLHEENKRASSVMAVLMGDSRQMFANHFFLKADAYFHYGTYPSIFDQALKEESHMTARSDQAHKHDGHDEHGEDEHEHDGEAADSHKVPNDWIQRFGRHFVLSAHKHLENGDEREILPWLKISVDLDPHRVTSYVTVSYWLRQKLNKPGEAEEFLRLGLRNNPDSYEILFELGVLTNESKKNPVVARRLWELALERWDKQKKERLKPDELVRMEILGQLAKSEDQSGHYDQAIAWLKKLKIASPCPDAVDKLIETVKAKTQPGK